MGIAAYPANSHEYLRGPLARVLFLDFTKHKVPTFVLLRNGLLCSPIESAFDIANVPSDTDLIALDPGDPRNDCQPLFDGHPCPHPGVVELSTSDGAPEGK